MEKDVYQVAIFAWKNVNSVKKKKEKAPEETDLSPSQINSKKAGSSVGFHIWNKSILENWISFYKFQRIILQELGIEPGISYVFCGLMCCKKESLVQINRGIIWTGLQNK